MKDDALYRLVYVSRNDIDGNDDRIGDEIRHILQTARRNNVEKCVTGALMFNSGCFAQVLEGPHDAVQDIFERIQCDTRHSHVSILAFEEVPDREFEHWSMAYVEADRGPVECFRDIRWESGFDDGKLSGERVFELLREHLADGANAT